MVFCAHAQIDDRLVPFLNMKKTKLVSEYQLQAQKIQNPIDITSICRQKTLYLEEARIPGQAVGSNLQSVFNFSLYSILFWMMYAVHVITVYSDNIVFGDYW